jgi:hypothetical protein
VTQPGARQASARGAGSAGLTLGQDTQSLDPAEPLPGYVYERILYALVGRVRSHVLVHAGAVAQRDHGIILAANAAHGKTTLVLELVRRWFRFLSDEMAALGRSDGRLHAFPRALRLRPDTLERVGMTAARAGAHAWLGKLLIDIDDLARASWSSRPC